MLRKHCNEGQVIQKNMSREREGSGQAGSRSRCLDSLLWYLVSDSRMAEWSADPQGLRGGTATLTYSVPNSSHDGSSPIYNHWTTYNPWNYLCSELCLYNKVCPSLRDTMVRCSAVHSAMSQAAPERSKEGCNSHRNTLERLWRSRALAGQSLGKRKDLVFTWHQTSLSGSWCSHAADLKSKICPQHRTQANVKAILLRAWIKQTLPDRTKEGGKKWFMLFSVS